MVAGESDIASQLLASPVRGGGRSRSRGRDVPSVPIGGVSSSSVPLTAPNVPPGLPHPAAKQLPGDLSKRIKHSIDEYKKTVQDLIKSKSRLAKFEKELEVYNQEDSHNYPEHTRGFKSAINFVELDDEWSLSAADKMQFLVWIPQGSSRRGAMLTVHHQCMKLLKSIEVEAQQAQASSYGSLVDDDILPQSLQQF